MADEASHPASLPHESPVPPPPPHTASYPPHPSVYAPHVPPPGHSVPPSGYAAPYWAAPAGPAPGLAYAGFWIRFVAYLIDSIIIFVPIWVVFFIVAGSTISGNAFNCTFVNTTTSQSFTCSGLGAIPLAFTALWLLTLFIPWVYFTVMWSWQGQSVGQKVLGLHVVDAANGLKISAGRAILRYFGIIISSWALLIGLIWAAFDSRKQGWHDKIATTFVVRHI